MRKIPKSALGFGLIEVLIAVVVLSIALLGLASLQSRSVQTLQEGDNLVMASMLAKEMAQRMMSNPYVTSLGRQGYLALDLSGAIASAGGVINWANATLSSSPDITGCYNSSNAQSCYDPGGSITSSSDHETALNNMMLMDQVEMRTMAWNILPQGQIKVCFDSTTAYSSFSCDNVATRISDRNENVYTVKVQWLNLFTNATQMFALQFTASCTNSSSSYCG